MVCFLKQDTDGIEKLFWDVYSLNANKGESMPFSHNLIVPFGLHMFNYLDNPIETIEQPKCIGDSMLKKLMKMTHYGEDPGTLTILSEPPEDEDEDETFEEYGDDLERDEEPDIDTFEEEEPVDLEAVSNELKSLEGEMTETDKTISDFCKELNIKAPF